MSIRKLAKQERKRLLEKLRKTEPGTESYEKIQKEIFKLEEIEEKRLDGTVRPKDVFSAVVTVLTTGAVITADSWIPTVSRYLKLEEFAKRIFK